MTVTMTRATLSEHYKAIRTRLGDPRTTQRIIPRERITPTPLPEPEPVTKHAPVVRRPPPEPIPLPPPKPNARQYVKILHDVATRHNMTPDDIISPNRSPRFVEARQEAFYLLKQAGYSMLQIGRFCNRDHTTVMHGANKHAAKLNGTTYTRNTKGEGL